MASDGTTARLLGPVSICAPVSSCRTEVDATKPHTDPPPSGHCHSPRSARLGGGTQELPPRPRLRHVIALAPFNSGRPCPSGVSISSDAISLGEPRPFPVSDSAGLVGRPQGGTHRSRRSLPRPRTATPLGPLPSAGTHPAGPRGASASAYVCHGRGNTGDTITLTPTRPYCALTVDPKCPRRTSTIS